MNVRQIAYKYFGVARKRELSREGKERLDAILHGEDAHTATSTGKWYRYKYHVLSGVARKDDTITFGRK